MQALPVPRHRQARPRTVLLIVASAMFMEQLDGTVLAPLLATRPDRDAGAELSRHRDAPGR
jgi:hypothetical protein